MGNACLFSKPHNSNALMLCHAASLCLVLMLFFSCSKLPEKRPANFSVRLMSNGGMMPVGSHIFISADSCLVKTGYQQVENVQTFSLPDTVLDALYATIYQNRFDCISTYTEQVYDRGGTTLEVQADLINKSVSNSGMNFVKKRWEVNFAKVENSVTNAAIDAVKQQIHSTPFEVDAELLEKYGSLSVSVNKFGLFPFTQQINSEKTQEEVLSLPLLLGQNYLQYSFTNPNALPLENSLPFLVLNCTPQTKAYRLTLNAQSQQLELLELPLK